MVCIILTATKLQKKVSLAAKRNTAAMIAATKQFSHLPPRGLPRNTTR